MAGSQTRIVILGGTGNCQDIADAIYDSNRAGPSSIICVGFLDDDSAIWGQTYAEIKVLGPIAEAMQHTDCYFVNGIGSPNSFRLKKEILTNSRIPKRRFKSIIHPSVFVARHAKIGVGVVLLQNVTVGARAAIGDHVIALPGSAISHDSVVGDYTCIATGATICGRVTIGDSCYVGANSVIREDTIIGDNSLIGIGAVVTKDVPPESRVVGNPARPLSSNV